MARSSSSRSSARDRILNAASELFYREGVQNVGIDRIIAESGVAKMSLYNHFKSKDALIAAWLQERDVSWRTWFQTTVEQLVTEPCDRILAVFDALHEWLTSLTFAAVRLLTPQWNSLIQIIPVIRFVWNISERFMIIYSV